MTLVRYTKQVSHPTSFLFSPELFRPADVFPMLGAARVRLVWRSKQHREGPVHGGLLPGPNEEAGEAGPAGPSSCPFPGHEPGAGQLPQRQGLRVGLHSLPW